MVIFISRTSILIGIANKDVDRKGPVFPNRVNNKCPAIIFAANHTARVPGRIKFLIEFIAHFLCIHSLVVFFFFSTNQPTSWCVGYCA